ncbi:hypothetical protein HaLaN_03027, partial [Haematococcus lacustris]
MSSFQLGYASSVSAELGATTGTINYRGKVLNRAARIAMQATPGKAALLEAVGTMSPVYVNGRAITAIDRELHAAPSHSKHLVCMGVTLPMAGTGAVGVQPSCPSLGPPFEPDQ